MSDETDSIMDFNNPDDLKTHYHQCARFHSKNKPMVNDWSASDANIQMTLSHMEAFDFEKVESLGAKGGAALLLAEIVENEPVVWVYGGDNPADPDDSIDVVYGDAALLDLFPEGYKRHRKLLDILQEWMNSNSYGKKPNEAIRASRLQSLKRIISVLEKQG